MSQIENNQDRDAQKREFALQLLDSYFMFRDNLPHEGYIQENPGWLLNAPAVT